MFAGALRVALFLRRRALPELPAGGADTRRPHDAAFHGPGQRAGRGADMLDVRETRRRPLPQHHSCDRRRRHISGQVPQDAHPRRPGLLREVLFHSRRPWLQGVQDQVRHRGRAHLLGPVVPRGSTHNGPQGCADSVLPHGHRLGRAPERARQPRAVCGVADHTAQPCCGQRRACGEREPHGPRGRHAVLGRLVHHQCLRTRAVAGTAL